ncbi:MAG: RES domain-containing protein [Paludibacteraceae bacterium]|nr:RES domain-containing protein [Paludibacteraceae bacterium]
MGRAKQMMIEDENRGYSLPNENKSLCADLYQDPYLRQYIISHSHKGKCSYTNKYTDVISLEEFIEYVMLKIYAHYTTPDNDDLYLEKSFYDDPEEIIPGLKRVNGYVTRENAELFDSKEELLENIGLISKSDTLNNDIIACIHNDTWIQKDSMVKTKHEELSDIWKQFVKMVTHQRRFTFYVLPEFDDLYFSSENGLQDILSELSNAIRNLLLYKPLSVNSTIYRCRYVENTNEVETFEQITSPPNDKASENRMNPAGISMFYGAFNDNTAKIEAKDSEKKVCVVAQFAVKRDLVVLDLTELPPLSFWNDYWQELAFIYSFSKEISKPIVKNQGPYEYVPTQIFAEYIRFCCSDLKGHDIDGIIFNSSKCRSKNIVLFYDQKKSQDVLILENITHYE